MQVSLDGGVVLEQPATLEAQVGASWRLMLALLSVCN